ncbi:uncharacterized protein [Lolium perenne]|uniref:uncharacterized protein n=1 Tax=Lolium perenne TaxID=4522 RepID=UPI0021F5F53F|nr:uncharacterized protein LOC127338516 [Lolium perenne]
MLRAGRSRSTSPPSPRSPAAAGFRRGFLARAPTPFPRGPPPSPSSSDVAALARSATAPPAPLAGSGRSINHRGPPTFAPVVGAHAPPPSSSAPAMPRACCAQVYLPPPADTDHARRLAFAVIEPAADAPGFLLRRALEELGGNPPVGLAASDFGALMVVFASPADRERALARAPLMLEGHSISLERPEDGANRAAWLHPRFAQLSATGFTLEHWDAHGIHAAFRSIGSVCCIDPQFLDGLDFSAVRVVVKLAHADDVPPILMVQDAFNECSSKVRMRIVRSWACDGAGQLHGHFHVGGEPVGARQSRLSDIDDDSVVGAASPPPPVMPPPQSSSVLNL